MRFRLWCSQKIAPLHDRPPACLEYEKLNEILQTMIETRFEGQQTLRCIQNEYMIITSPIDSMFVQISKRKNLSLLQEEAIAEAIALEASIPADNAAVVGTGWKIHVTVDQVAPDNLRKAWDIVTRLMHRYGIPTAKIIRKNHYFIDVPVNMQHTQDNKQITIFLGSTALVERHRETIKNFIIELHNALEVAEIIPGSTIPPLSAELVLSKSSYLSYRNDCAAKSGHYIDSTKPKHLTPEETYNRSGTADPFKTMSLSLKSRLKRQWLPEYQIKVNTYQKRHPTRPIPPAGTVRSSRQEKKGCVIM